MSVRGSRVAGSNRETCVGADNRAAGRTAGLLLGRMAGRQSRDTLLLAVDAFTAHMEVETRHDYLETAATQTGGRAVADSPTVSEEIDQISLSAR